MVAVPRRPQGWHPLRTHQANVSSGLAQQALLCSLGCPSHKCRPCETPTARKRDSGLKCAENIPENAGPFLRGAATAEAGPSFSALAPQVRGGSGPSPRSPKGAPGWGLREYLPPARGTWGAAGGLRPGRTQHATWTVPHPSHDSGCLSLTFGGPQGSPLHASWESQTLATQRGCAQL